MRSKVFCVILGVGLGILGVGCQTLRGPKGDGSTDGTRHFTPGPQALVIDPTNGNVLTRWIGQRSLRSKGCPEVNGWIGEPLLSPALAKSRDDSALITELGLDRFCVYTPRAGYTQPFAAPPDLKASMDRLAISTATDEMVQGSLLQANSSGVAQALTTEFLSQAGHLPPSPGLPSGSTSVQITVLDTQPEGSSPPPPTSPQHGFVIANLARKLVCDGTVCAATVVNKRALNYGDPTHTITQLAPDLPGSIGTVSELGQAIYEAVPEYPHGKHLILNLSIGWDGEMDLGGKGLSDAALFVQGILELAARKQVLVVAAAGNRRGGSPEGSNWPILPAAWDSSPSYPSLIYAVGGVDWQGLPLPNSRTNGLPVRVAYGDHATTFVNKIPTVVYTGTSVSTAVVSATAAMVWHLRPHLTPAEVMHLIDSSGEKLPALAEFYPGRSTGAQAPQIREVSLCAAVKKVCAKYGLNCSTLACPAQHQPPALASLLAQCGPDLGTPFSKATSPSPVPAPCIPSTLLLTQGGDPGSPPICPTDQYGSLSAQPWVLPQPGDDPCPNCALVPTGPPGVKSQVSISPSGVTAFAGLSYVPSRPQYQLAIALNRNWLTALKTAELADAKLQVTAMLDIDCFVPDQPMSRTTYPVKIDYQAATAWTAFGFGDGRSLKGCRAQLNFVVQDNTGNSWSVQNPIVVDPEPSDLTCAPPSPNGSIRSVSAPSTNVVTLGPKERKTATQPPL
jgi:hypothetical protein